MQADSQRSGGNGPVAEDERENPVPFLQASLQPWLAGNASPNLAVDKQDEAAQHWQALASQQQEEDAYLLQLAGEGITSLAEVERLQVVADTFSSSISHLGAKLPALQELNLNNSLLESLRDLGTGFSMLAVLWVSRCSLSGLEGAGALPNLRELYASYNDIMDLQPLGAGCEQLEVLDLEGNCIADEDSVAQLEGCPGLTSLVLAGNPLCQSLPRYRARVVAALPSLRILDDREVSGSELDEADDSCDLLLQRSPPQTVIGGSSRTDAGNVGSAVMGSPDMHMTSSHILQASLAHQLDSSQQQAVANGLSSSPPSTGLGGLTGSKAVLGSPEFIAAAKAAAAASGLPASRDPSSGPLSRADSLLLRSELSMVSEGIKHARVGVDSHEFQQMEMSLLVSTADGRPSGATFHHLPGAGSAPATAYPGSNGACTSGMPVWSTPPATASSSGASGRPSSGPLPPSSPSLAASLMPAGAATWMRTLRASQQVQAQLQDLEQSNACRRRPGSDGDICGKPRSPNRSGSFERGSSGCYPSSSPPFHPTSPHATSASSPSHSRPHSSRGEQAFGDTGQGRTRPGTGSSTGGAPAGQQQLLRLSSGQMPPPPRSPHDSHSANSAAGPLAKAPAFPPEAPPRTAAAAAAAARPFSACLATGSVNAARSGTAALSSSASAASTSAAGLYWAKHRIVAAQDGGEQGRRGGSSATGNAASVGAGVGGAAPGLLQRGSEGVEEGGGSSQLTHGRDASSTFGGSLAKDLRRWKGAAKAAAAEDGSSTAPASASAASSAHANVRHSAAHAGWSSGAHGAKDGQFLNSGMDHDALLVELRRWKVETADRALLDEEGGIPSVGGPVGVMQAWADPADIDGHPRMVHADVLQLGTETDGIEAGMDSPLPLLSPVRLHSGASGQGRGTSAPLSPPFTTAAGPALSGQHWGPQGNGEDLLAPSFVPGTAWHVDATSVSGSQTASADGLPVGGQGRGPSKMPLAKAVRDTAGRNGNVSCAAAKSASRPLCAAHGPEAVSGQTEYSQHHLHKQIYSGSSSSGPAQDARPALSRTASSGIGSSTNAAVASPSRALSHTASQGVAAQPSGTTSRGSSSHSSRPDTGQGYASPDLPSQGSLQRGGSSDHKASVCAEYRVLSIGGEVDLCIVNPRPRIRQAATSDDEGPG